MLWTCYEQNIDRDSSLETNVFVDEGVAKSIIHHIVEGVKTLRFTATYYIETTNHKHFLDRKITSIYKQ